MLEFDEESHTYKWNGEIVPGVTDILTGAGLIDKRFYTDQGRQRGKLIHETLQYLDEGCLDWDSVDDRFHGYISAYQAFKKDSGFNPIEIEQRVFSKDYGFAGTFDRLGELEGFNIIIDIKTGKADHWAALQLAAYQLALNKQKIKRAVVEVRENGTYLFKEYTGDSDCETFVCALRLYHWKRTVALSIQKRSFLRIGEGRWGKLKEEKGMIGSEKLQNHSENSTLQLVDSSNIKKD